MGAPAAGAGLNLACLEGIRAFANIWVVLVHVYVIVISNQSEAEAIKRERASPILTYVGSSDLGGEFTSAHSAAAPPQQRRPTHAGS